MKRPVEKDIWEIFCAAEEQSVTPGDSWGRILYRDRSHSQVASPSVSDFLFANGFKPHYPQGQSFAVCVSHDVDHLLQNKLSAVDRLKGVARELISGYHRRAFHYLDPGHPINPNYNIERLLDIEREFGAKSTFYFLSLQPHEQDFNYRLSEVTAVLNEVRASGCEVGLHGGHTAYADVAKLASEKAALEQSVAMKVNGYRNHFLKMKIPETLEYLAQTGFKYDTTHGFPDHPGFRSGMCYPYFPYHRQKQQFLDILEIPLMVMDASFIYYLNLKKESVIRTIQEVIDKTKKVNGVFTVLWHNNYLYHPWKDVFEFVLRYCKESGAWFATGEEMNDWWRANNFCAEYSRYGLHPINI